MASIFDAAAAGDIGAMNGFLEPQLFALCTCIMWRNFGRTATYHLTSTRRIDPARGGPTKRQAPLVTRCMAATWAGEYPPQLQRRALGEPGGEESVSANAHGDVSVAMEIGMQYFKKKEAEYFPPEEEHLAPAMFSFILASLVACMLPVMTVTW
eukprot:s2025_g19.t1